MHIKDADLSFLLCLMLHNYPLDYYLEPVQHWSDEPTSGNFSSQGIFSLSKYLRSASVSFQSQEAWSWQGLSVVCVLLLWVWTVV